MGPSPETPVRASSHKEQMKLRGGKSIHMEGREGGGVGVRKKMTDMWGAILSEFPVSMTFSIQVKLVRLKQWKMKS